MVRTLAEAGDRQARAYARKVGQAYIDDPTADGAESAWGLQVLVEDGGPKLRDALLAKAAAETTMDRKPVYLRYAAAVPGDATRDLVLARVIAPETPVMDAYVLLGGLGLTRDAEADQDAMHAWLMRHHEALASKMPPPMRMQLARMGIGCSTERLRKSQAFFGDPERALPGTERILAEAADRVGRCLARREAHGATVRAFLEAWAAR